ncbi:hypothetical protein [Streptomyces scopuliridis]|uniref:Secreted protein n=1 Tax=Streptomyces scopuliridis RB72 TaxID=1440053 RepID=A0A2T7T7H8_9ACTN|nr:hypothetical protein [Streptomyces scopuliridis]PVE11061.1 hypothetical protein Y717_18445 [Streptomyces scopuliridis RB72]
MARHAASLSPRRTLLRAGLTLTAAGVALGLGGTAAQAADPAAPTPATGTGQQLSESSSAAGQALTGSVGYVLGPLTDLKLYPLAKTGVDPLDNAVGAQIADFKPVSTAPLTAPLTEGAALKDVPVLGPTLGAAAGLLTG